MSVYSGRKTCPVHLQVEDALDKDVLVVENRMLEVKAAKLFLLSLPLLLGRHSYMGALAGGGFP